MLKGWERHCRARCAVLWPGLPFVDAVSRVPGQDTLAAIEAELAAAPEGFCLAAWRNPERNMDIPAVWLARLGLWIDGQGGRLDFFLARGGIEGMLARIGRRVDARQPILGGAATLAVCEKLAPFVVSG